MDGEQRVSGAWGSGKRKAGRHTGPHLGGQGQTDHHDGGLGGRVRDIQASASLQQSCTVPTKRAVKGGKCSKPGSFSFASASRFQRDMEKDSSVGWYTEIRNRTTL